MTPYPHLCPISTHSPRTSMPAPHPCPTHHLLPSAALLQAASPYVLITQCPHIPPYPHTTPYPFAPQIPPVPHTLLSPALCASQCWHRGDNTRSHPNPVPTLVPISSHPGAITLPQPYPGPTKPHSPPGPTQPPGRHAPPDSGSGGEPPRGGAVMPGPGWERCAPAAAPAPPAPGSPSASPGTSLSHGLGALPIIISHYFPLLPVISPSFPIFSPLYFHYFP